MSAATLIRFCNNPVCDRCDEHLSARDVLRKAGREICPACLEPLVLRAGRTGRAARLPTPPARGGARRPR